MKRQTLTQQRRIEGLLKQQFRGAVGACWVAALSLGLASVASAQEDPPPGAATDPPPGAAEEAAPDEAAAAAAMEGEGEFAADPYEGDANLEIDEGAAEPDLDADERRRSAGEYSGLSGATGLMRVQSASSGHKGTFRFSLLTGFYSGTGFLCPQCPDSNGNGSTRNDSVDRVSANVYLSVTPLAFLEAYLGIYSQSTSDSLGEPQLLQVVGDWNLGAKAFLPSKPDQLLSAGGSLEFLFATGSGEVGAASVDSVNVDIRGLATLDLSRRSDPQKKIPLRAHANLGYLFDNSANLVKDFEESQNSRINRIQRFSLDINRVDSFQVGLGVEGLFKVVRPFLEWSIDVPTNRQSYVCTRNTDPGDSCLRDASALSAMPSRLTAGIRAMPWLEGLTFNGVFDVATGGSSNFIVEVAPEAPWSIWFGLGYAVDPSPRVIAAPVAPPPPPPQAMVQGLVVEKGTQTPIANASVRFEGRELTGLITTSAGRFTSETVEPGTYTLAVTADGYKAGTCKAEVGAGSLASEPYDDPESDAPPAAPAPAPANKSVTCELEPVPKVSNINGVVADANTGLPVGTAKVKIVDVLGRALDLRVDEEGAFRFENVPPGISTITLGAPNYLSSVNTLKVEALQDLERRFPLFPVPQKPSVRIAQNQIQLDKPIEFEPNTATLTTPSIGVVQELAKLLSEHPLGEVEVQSHTSDAGPAHDALSLERANAVRDMLILHGVPSGLLVARGLGGSEPARQGTNEEARRANERVRFKVVTPVSGAVPAATPALPPPPALPQTTTPLPKLQ
jgi:OmpA-OmpF porin, OOP family